MPQGKGQFLIEILADGRVRIETGDMGGVHHKSADELLKGLEGLLGGPVTQEPVKHAHHHGHAHDHAHDHSHAHDRKQQKA